MADMETSPVFPVDLDSYRQNVEKLAADYAAALHRMVATKAKLRAAVLASIAAGISENEAARLSGFTRKSVRDWQGKK